LTTIGLVATKDAMWMPLAVTTLPGWDLSPTTTTTILSKKLLLMMTGRFPLALIESSVAPAGVVSVMVVAMAAVAAVAVAAVAKIRHFVPSCYVHLCRHRHFGDCFASFRFI
jgi:hypothetical protein